MTLARRLTAYLAGVQERLRAAELARVEAQAKAAEERKRRRLTVAPAASLLLMAASAVGSSAYLSNQQRERAGKFNRALGEAEGLYAEAVRAGDDLCAGSRPERPRMSSRDFSSEPVRTNRPAFA